MNKNYLQKYSKDWSKKFNVESKKIKLALDNKIIDIQHIGSTSIPEMIAKPIIDIGVLVNSIEDISFFTKKLKNLEYVYKPDMSSAERIFLRKGYPAKYHLSIACPKHTFWERQIKFRNYLRKHQELREEYISLKIKNIKLTPKKEFIDLSKSRIYNQEKSNFVKKVLNLSNEEKNV